MIRMQPTGTFTVDALQREVRSQRDGSSGMYAHPEGEGCTNLEVAAGIVDTIDGNEAAVKGQLGEAERKSGHFSLELPPDPIRVNVGGVLQAKVPGVSGGSVDMDVAPDTGAITQSHKEILEVRPQPNPSHETVYWPPLAALKDAFSNHDLQVGLHTITDHYVDKTGRDHYVRSEAILEGDVRVGEAPYNRTEVVMDRSNGTIAMFEGDGAYERAPQ